MGAPGESIPLRVGMLRFARISHLFCPLVFGVIALATSARSARAVPYYFEFGGSMATLTNPAPLFQSLGKTASTESSSTFAVPFTFGVHLQENQRGLLFSIALQGRYLSGQTGAGENFMSMTASPMVRMEIWRIVVGAGYTPFAFKDLSFSRNGGVDSVLTLEAQFLFPITPEIDFGLQAARQTFTTAFGDGPDPSFEYGAFFRLNFGLSSAAAGERRKFKGWRYPLGSPL